MKRPWRSASIAALALSCQDPSPTTEIDSAVVLDTARAMVAAVDTIHGIVGRQARLVFRERSLDFDTVGDAGLTLQSHGSTTIAAVKALGYVDTCPGDDCEIPPALPTNDQMVVCSIPRAARDGLETYCVLLMSWHGEIAEAGAYIFLKLIQGQWRVDNVRGYHIS